MNWIISGPLPNIYPAVMATTGKTDQLTQAQFNECVKVLKESLRAIDQALTGDWLVGSHVSIADVVIASTLSIPF